MEPQKETLIACCVCQRIKDRNGKWYLSQASDGERQDYRLSHGLCPECADVKWSIFELWRWKRDNKDVLQTRRDLNRLFLDL